MCLKTEEDQNRQERSENMAKKKKEGLKEKSAQYINKYKDWEGIWEKSYETSVVKDNLFMIESIFHTLTRIKTKRLAKLE
jgi:hypothetical protein